MEYKYECRSEPSRFEPGQYVEISARLHNRLAGLRGRIVRVQPSRYTAALDKYLVRLRSLPAVETETFWDMELQRVEPMTEAEQ